MPTAGTSCSPAIARADQEPDQATIDKAIECWKAQSCDTGSGGDLVMGYADGGGDTVNVWRSVSHMEAILQALSYPEIGKIVSQAANFDQDPEVHANGVRFLVQSGADFIVGYPDVGVALAGAVSEAEAAGVPYLSFSAGYVGLPGQEGALDARRGLHRGDRRGPVRARRELRRCAQHRRRKSARWRCSAERRATR